MNYETKLSGNVYEPAKNLFSVFSGDQQVGILKIVSDIRNGAYERCKTKHKERIFFFDDVKDQLKIANKAAKGSEKFLSRLLGKCDNLKRRHIDVHELHDQI